VLPFSVSLRSGVPIHDQVVYAVTRAIVAGQLAPRDPFPSVRALSQELGINPNTAHKIVATLIDDGLLAVRPGIGTVVSDSSRRGAGAAAPDEEVERLVVLAQRAGMSLQDLLAAVRRQWTGTSSRAAERPSARQAESGRRR